jgi:hypothetical protein
MSFLDRIAECNAHDPAAFRPFFAGGHEVGAVRHKLAERLRGFPAVFDVAAERVAIVETLANPAARTAALDTVVRALEAKVRSSAGATRPIRLCSNGAKRRFSRSSARPPRISACAATACI